MEEEAFLCPMGMRCYGLPKAMPHRSSQRPPTANLRSLQEPFRPRWRIGALVDPELTATIEGLRDDKNFEGEADPFASACNVSHAAGDTAPPHILRKPLGPSRVALSLHKA